jgi:hypothetical protein
LLLRYLTEKNMPKAQMLTKRQLRTADLDQDGLLTMLDVMMLLSNIRKA